MVPCPCNRIAIAPVRTWLVLALVGLLVGCAAQSPTPASGGKPTRASEQKVSEKDRPRLEMDGHSGFTVTEVVRIGSDVRADYQRALVLLQRDDLEGGTALLEQVTERAPELSAPYIDLGVAYGRMGEHDKAEKRLQAALTRAPNHPAALNEMGIVYRHTGRFDQARESYERALSVHPGYHYALLNLGVLCDLFLEDLQCALESYQGYADILGDDPQVDIWIADVRNRMAAVQQE